MAFNTCEKSQIIYIFFRQRICRGPTVIQWGLNGVLTRVQEYSGLGIVRQWPKCGPIEVKRRPGCGLIVGRYGSTVVRWWFCDGPMMVWWWLDGGPGVT